MNASACLLLFLLAGALPAQNLFVASRNTDEILQFDGNSGAFLGVFANGGGLDNPVGVTFGPDRNLYVVSANTNQVLRYHGNTGAFLGVFVPSSSLSAPRQLNFGPDGRLYVANAGTNQILRFDPVSGAALGVAAQHPSLSGPTSFTFGPLGDLWVGGVLSNNILRFDGSGVLRQTITSPRLNGPHDLSLGPDGRLYVTNAFGPDKLVRFDPVLGAFIDLFVADAQLVNPLGITWRLDGDLLVANQGRNEIRRYDGRTGALVGVHVVSGAGNLSGPLFVALTPRGGIAVLPPDPPTAGNSAVFPVVGARPGGLVVHIVGSVPGTLPLPFCPGQALGMLDPIVLGIAAADESGHAIWRFAVPAGLSGSSLLLGALDLTDCMASATQVHRF